MADTHLVDVQDLSVHYSVRYRGRRRALKAVDGVSLHVAPGECLGIVGESGCGKSTLSLAMAGLVAPTAGRISLAGESHEALRRRDAGALARHVQMVFQDPYASLNPRHSIRRALEEPLKINGVSDKATRDAKVARILRAVGLTEAQAALYPHQFSGGQRQRICIARALIMEPELVIGDEPVSALDVSVRAQIINLLLRLKDEFSLSYVIVSHDLTVIEHLCDKVAVMYLGRIVESGSWDDVFGAPRHPYTRALLAAVPDPFSGRSRTQALEGDVPNPLDPPSGCHFRTRCPKASSRCAEQQPQLDARSGHGEHRVACHFPIEHSSAE
jgi:oligopeptide/dipeptide ABC transporter ATP-binding protein